VRKDREETQGQRNSSQKGQAPGSRGMGRDEEESDPNNAVGWGFGHVPAIACSADAYHGVNSSSLHPHLFLRLWVFNHVLSGLNL